MEDKKNILTRIYIVYLLVCIFAIAIIVQLVKTQSFEGDHWKQVAENFTTEYKDIDAVRGNIFDMNGYLLATSLPYYEVAMDVNADGISDKVFEENADSLALSFANLFNDRSKAEFKKMLTDARKEKKRFLVLQKSVSYEDLQLVKRFPLLRKGRYGGGFICTQNSKRELPFRELASRTIGRYNENSKPLGLEGAYNVDLKGVGGKRLMRKIAGGVEMPVNDDNEIEPQDGCDLTTTIDINIQDVAENALMKQLIAHNADHGCVILMEVSTGEIRAIANLSKQDSNTYAEVFNWAIGARTEPGSTFKLASLMAGMEDGYITLDELVDLNNGYTEWGSDHTPMHDAERPKKNISTVMEVFAHSSNVGVSKLISKYYSKDPQKFIDRLNKMGVNAHLNLQIPGGADALLKNTKDESWSSVSLPFISIGYESLITPIQTLTFYNAVANNGCMMKPIFVRDLRRRGLLIRKFEPEVLNPSICSRSTIDKAKKLMEEVVMNGTAKNLQSSIYQVAGKTGTAQIAHGKRGYGKNSVVNYQASFVGYFPADHPKYSCMVMVSAPSGDVYYGALVAGPIFKEVADKIYSTSLDIHQDLNSQLLTTNVPKTKGGSGNDIKKIFTELHIPSTPLVDAEWVLTSQKDSTISFHSSNIKEQLRSGSMPDVTGMGIKDALYLLENAGLTVRTLGRGTVKKQSLPPGVKFVKGTAVTIELS
jgi:cell division protein FtsI (penicillin-binding protein 3)